LPNVTTIGEGAFSGNRLIRLHLPVVTTIKRGAFYKNRDLASIHIYTNPDLLTIGEHIFHDHSGAPITIYIKNAAWKEKMERKFSAYSNVVVKVI